MTPFLAVLSGMALFAALAQLLFISRLHGWRRAAAVAAVLVLALGGAEAALAPFDGRTSHKTLSHPTLLWVLNSAWRGDGRISSRGFRYEEFPDAKVPGELRIILIGDSSAYGQDIPQGLRFSDLLEKRLRARWPGRTVRVVNAAVQGYSIYQGRTLYDLALRRLSPDCVILSFNNDIFNVLMSDEDTVPPESLRPLSMLLHRSRLFLGARQALCGLQGAKGGGLRWRVPPARIEAHYRHIIEDMKRRGGATVILAMPNRDLGPSPLTEYRKILGTIADGTGALLVDIHGEWRGSLRREALFLRSDAMHPSIAGNASIAAILYREMTESRLLPEP